MTTDAGEQPTLVSALLQDLLGQAPTLAAQAHTLLAPVARRRNDLRARLEDEGQILPLPDDAEARPPSVVAVDGGSVREHLYAADLMVAVAASADGMSGLATQPLRQRHWTQVLAHESENDRLLSAAMASLELLLLADLTHSLRILDGSHGTPVIALSTALAARSATVAAHAADLVTDDVVAALASLADPDARTHPGEVVALPKADASHAFSDLYRHDYDLDLPGGDRFVAAQVLRPGEMLYPRPAAELTSLHFPVPEEATRRVQEAAAALNAAITPLRAAAQARQVLVTYVKPRSADTVIKAEIRVSDSLPDRPSAPSTAVTETQRMAALLSAETPGPHLQEPFAQYAVDLAAKSVAVGAEALNASMLAHLPPGSEDYAVWLARSYRTKAAAGASTRPGGGRPTTGR